MTLAVLSAVFFLSPAQLSAGPIQPAAPTPDAVTLDADAPSRGQRLLDVPEPGTLTTLGLALVAAGLVRRRKVAG